MNDTTSNKTISKFLKDGLQGHFLVDEPLSRHTWYRIGGPADFLIYPKDESNLIELCLLCNELGVDTYVIGKGANLLVSDKGLRGVVLNLEKHFRWINREGNSVRVGAGVTLEELIVWCENEKLGGLEGLAGIPATLGGALAMNAGTSEIEIGGLVKEVKVVDEAQKLKVLTVGEIGYGYRTAPGLQGKTIVDCCLKLYPENPARLRDTRMRRLMERASKQPLEFPSCGCVFKRPKGDYAGRLIQEAGLKGLRHGNAMVSDKHAGFIVNLGGATAEDVLFLIRKIQKAISELFGVDLEPEVKLIGF